MLEHPEQLGFKLGLTIRIGEPAHIMPTPEASTCDVVYVALFGGTKLPLEKRDVLKVGQTKKSLLARNSTATIFGCRRLKANEKEDRRKWLEAANGREVEVWVKAAEKIEIPYASGLTRSRFSARCAEEEFLDHYYEPKLGMSLNREQEPE
jgi:hypothetical protein